MNIRVKKFKYYTLSKKHKLKILKKKIEKVNNFRYNERSQLN